MLYLTTRNKVDSFTAHHVLCHDRSSDGGYFVPIQLPEFSCDDLEKFAEKTFGQSVADVLNCFFSARLDGWDVDFCIGRYPVRLVPMNHKVYIAEAWHNPNHLFERMVRNLCARIRGDRENTTPTDWMRMAARIAVLFAVYGQMRKLGALQQGQRMDVSVCADDFSVPMAAWYAKRMGLPIGTIICTNQDNSRFWDFLRHGTMQIDSLSRTPNASDVERGVIPGLERLVYSVFGHEETGRYLQICAKGGVYALNELRRNQLLQGIRAAVVSSRRAATVIRSTYSSAAYILDPKTALAFGGLQDMRTSAGEARPTLLVSEQSPGHFVDLISNAAGIPTDELRSRYGGA